MQCHMLHTKKQKLRTAYLAPATSNIGALRFVRRNEPEVAVAIPTKTHLSTSYGNIQMKDIGMYMLRAYPAAHIAMLMNSKP